MPGRCEFQVLIWDGEYWSRGREGYAPGFLETYLNRMAMDGWDMVGITATTLILRREVPNACSTLEEALKNSLVAISCPNGEYFALKSDESEHIHIRRVHRVSGHGGSVLDTGEWIDVKDVPPTILWRPA